MLNYRIKTHCRRLPKETKIHDTSGVPNPPRENTLPRDEDSILTRTLNYDALVSGDLDNILWSPRGRSDKSQIDRGARHAKKST